MTCPRPGSRWVAEPRAQQPALFAPCFCSLPLPSPPFLPSSMAQASPVYPRGWTRNGGSPWEAEAQSGWELPEHRRCLHRPLCCTAGPLGRRWAPSGASRALGTPEDKANAGCPLRYGAGSLSTPFSVSSLTFMGIFQLLSVHPLTSDSLDLDK